MAHLLCLITAGSPCVYEVKLTLLQSSPPRVSHGHGAENAGSTKPKFDSHVYMELTMKNLFARFAKDESGATAIEYGLIAAGISLAIIAIVNGLGANVKQKFTDINSSLK
jgi:pilus assembly protein Flp/PilA